MGVDNFMPGGVLDSRPSEWGNNPARLFSTSPVFMLGVPNIGVPVKTNALKKLLILLFVALPGDLFPSRIEITM